MEAILVRVVSSIYCPRQDKKQLPPTFYVFCGQETREFFMAAPLMTQLTIEVFVNKNPAMSRNADRSGNPAWRLDRRPSRRAARTSDASSAPRGPAQF
jgi:hypothetical protein